MTTIVHKRGTGIPAADDLTVGEIAIDTSTGTAYTKNNSGEVVPVGGDAGGDAGGGDFVHKNEDNEIGSEFYLRNASWTMTINETEVIAPVIAGYGIAALGTGYSRKNGSPKMGDYAFQVINADGTDPMHITHDGVVQAQDYLDKDGNSIIGAGGGDPEWAKVSQENKYVYLGYDQTPMHGTSNVSIGSSVMIDGREAVGIGASVFTRDQSVSIGHRANSDDPGGVSLGYGASCKGLSIALGKNAQSVDKEFAISPLIETVNFSGATVQAKDFLDADGNSIIGSGGGGDVDLTGYATETWVSANYQLKGNYLTSETDPTVPSWVKSITQNDINNWNNNSGGGSYTLPLAGNGTRGGVQVGFATSGRNYAVQLSGEKMYVNVPWTDTNTDTTYGPATSSVYGLVKIGYSANGKNYPVQLSNGQMYVNVPWTDSGGSSYTQGNGISISGSTISLSGQYQSNSPFLFDYKGDNTSLHIASANARGAEIWLNSGSNTANKYMRANPNGNWEVVNGAYSSVLLAVNNTGDLTATGDVMAYSDERLKDNIETLDGSKVYEMRGVSYTKDGRAGSGVIAQELQKVAPELVSDEGEYLTVAYGNLVGYLIEAVKDLKAEVEELKRGL